MLRYLSKLFGLAKFQSKSVAPNPEPILAVFPPVTEELMTRLYGPEVGGVTSRIKFWEKKSQNGKVRRYCTITFFLQGDCVPFAQASVQAPKRAVGLLSYKVGEYGGRKVIRKPVWRY